MAWNCTSFGQFVFPSSGVYSLYTHQWYISYKFVDSFRAGPSWWWTEELSETCRVSCQNKFVKLVHLVGFIIKKFVTMHVHMNVNFRIQLQDLALQQASSQNNSGSNILMITLMFLSPTNALLYYTYKILKYTVKISHDCSYMFRSIWTIIREPMPNLAKVTILCRYSVKIRR